VEKDVIAEIAWDSCFGRAVKKHINVARYPKLDDAIPDDTLEIQDMITFAEANEVFERVRPYTEDQPLFPIGVALGDSILLMGYGPENRGIVYYLDFDFGLFELEPLEPFLAALFPR
jgi:hypothetical protein